VLGWLYRRLADGRVYELLGLVAELRLKGQMPLPDGDGGLGGLTLRDRRADMAEVW
jgi:hypothetical protein